MSLLKQDIKRFFASKFYDNKPTTLNLLVNDVCNSRCQMCLIWKNKAAKEFSPNELKEILSDELFLRLEYCGISGGEPTLRKELPQIFDVLCKKIPKLKGLGIITNGILHDKVKERILECASICRTYKIPFSIMISIDGIGDIHDVVRGRSGNFESSIKLLKFFSTETDIPTSFGCTITKDNVFYVDELVDYAKENNLYGRFRIAEFIDRLYNDSQAAYIRSFNNLESYHLGLLFHRLENDFETNDTFRKTYNNIRQMITEGKPRQIGCPYQSNSIVMTSKGDLLFCSPKSPILGSALAQSANSIYYSNLNIRNDIKGKNCTSCIHDYHDPFTFKEYTKCIIDKLEKRKIYSLNKLLNESTKLPYKIQKYKSPRTRYQIKNVLIVGWYGTETNGDKAILWSIVNRVKSREKQTVKIILTSFHPFVSTWTISEMKLDNISIVETYTTQFEQAVKEADEIIVGGGPLMDLKCLDHILYAFIQGKKNNAITRVEGCGLGPLENKKYIKVVQEILRLADEIILRDEASIKICYNNFNIRNAKLGYDPARDFVLYYKNNENDFEVKPLPFSAGSYLACFLREWTTEYSLDLDKVAYLNLKDSFEKNLSLMVLYIAQTCNAHIHLFPMHSFHIGGDDRIFSRKLVSSINTKIADLEASSASPLVEYSAEPLSPAQILASMNNSKLNLCMRFHSVLFAETLGVPYLAIDYTRGGKIRAFLSEKNQLSRLLTLEEVANGIWKPRVDMLLSYL